MGEELHNGVRPSDIAQVVYDVAEVIHGFRYFEWGLGFRNNPSHVLLLEALKHGFDYRSKDGVKEFGLLLVLGDDGVESDSDVVGIFFCGDDPG